MKPRYKLSTLVTLAAIASVSLIPKPAIAVPAMSWTVRNFGNTPDQCYKSAAQAMRELGLSTTQEGSWVKGFTSKTGVVVVCSDATVSGACYGHGSVASMFITSDESKERDQIANAMAHRFKVPISVCND
ncbi:MAG: hypothetical protein ACAF41_00990 (plasmid) [Leptolyngbya sp. BL-A-14]